MLLRELLGVLVEVLRDVGDVIVTVRGERDSVVVRVEMLERAGEEGV